MQLYHDQDADLRILDQRTIAVIGYGNQGRSQALNLRDSGLNVIVGNRQDRYRERADMDGFAVRSISSAVAQADLLLLLIPDEVMPSVFREQIVPHLKADGALVFASGYTIAFDLLHPPEDVDVLMVAPRMIGAGVRELYLADRGFPSFVGVAQDHSGRAMEIALALAKGIGSTRAGVVKVTFSQEAELDLFTEQCFGPAFGHVLTSSVELLLEEGYPPAAVLLELYMSGELSYTLGKIAEVGMIEQGRLHSRTSQYGSMSRGMRFQLPELRDKLRQGLEEIRSGQFAQEWAAEQEQGCPTLAMLRESARTIPLYALEMELREALGDVPSLGLVRGSGRPEPPARAAEGPSPGLLARWAGFLRRLIGRGGDRLRAQEPLEPLTEQQLKLVLESFVELAAVDPALREFADGRQLTTHYVLRDTDLEFYLAFQDGRVIGGVEEPSAPAEVRLETKAAVLDAMLTDRINPARAAMAGKISFQGDARQAVTVQRVQSQLIALYREARDRAIDQPG